LKSIIVPTQLADCARKWYTPEVALKVDPGTAAQIVCKTAAGPAMGTSPVEIPAKLELTGTEIDLPPTEKAAQCSDYQPNAALHM
jgi:hypothetical protein